VIEPHDITQQKQVYSRNGTGRWAVLGYCPTPSVTMVNLETGERLHFGLAGSMNGEFEPRVGELCGPDERVVSAHNAALTGAEGVRVEGIVMQHDKERN